MTSDEICKAVAERPELAALWADVFTTEPEPPAVAKPEHAYVADPVWAAWQARERWERLQRRTGRLKPDAAYEIGKVLGVMAKAVAQAHEDARTK